METLTVNLSAELLALVPVVAAILQAAKRLAVVQKYAAALPFVSILLSVGLTFAIKADSHILPGIIIGLVASGGYDLLRAPAPRKT